MKKRHACNDLYTIFYMAEAFYLSAETSVPLANNPERFKSGDAVAGHLITVYFVNIAFAIELYLKCLACIEQKEFKSGHNLYELFCDLSEENQRKLAADFNELGSAYSLPSLLQEAGNTFQNFRYMFEDIKSKFNSFRVQRVIPIIRKRISELNAELITEDFGFDLST